MGTARASGASVLRSGEARAGLPGTDARWAWRAGCGVSGDLDAGVASDLLVSYCLPNECWGRSSGGMHGAGEWRWWEVRPSRGPRPPADSRCESPVGWRGSTVLLEFSVMELWTVWTEGFLPRRPGMLPGSLWRPVAGARA